ncbi:MAG: hypothetical protein Q7K38_01510, partial [Candidatus Wildermuthbacteria bacterium]|nr:hypothetical protein [Candidatus Wildermuthbacteria bacterium]
MAKPKTKVKYISLQDAAKQTSYSQEYLSLRARQGKLRALKIGRNWVTTKAWVKEYVKLCGDPQDGFHVETSERIKYVAPPTNLPIEGLVETPLLVPIEIPVGSMFKVAGALALVLFFAVRIHALDLPSRAESFVPQIPNHVKNFAEGFDRGAREIAIGFPNQVQLFGEGFDRGSQEVAIRTHRAVQDFGRGFDTGVSVVIASLPSVLQNINLSVAEFGEGFAYGVSSPASVETFAKDYGEWLFKQSTSLPRGYTSLDQKVSEGIAQDVNAIGEAYENVNNAIAKGIESNIQGLGEGVSNLAQKTKGGFLAFRNAIGGTFGNMVGGIKERFAKKEVPSQPEEPTQTPEVSEEAQPQPEIVTKPEAGPQPTGSTQIVREVVREVVRTERVLDSQELALLKAQVAGILTWRGDIDSLKAITQKIQSSPPQSYAVNAPVYIGSTGVQVAGNISGGSIGATIGGVKDLGIGLSATIGETNNSASKLTVNAESFFNSQAKFTAALLVGTSALTNLSIDTSGNVETKGYVKVLNSEDVAQITLGTNGNITITGTL